MLGLRQNKKKAPKDLPNRFHVKMGDTVWVTHGKNKGETGIVRKTFHDQGKVLVEGINKVKKAIKPNPMIGQQGGIVEMEVPMPVAKVMLYCLQCNKPTRVKKTTLDNGKKVRTCQKCNAQFDQ